VLAALVLVPLVTVPPAQASGSAPVLFPADGAVVRTPDLTVTAQYGERVRYGSAIQVLDVTTGRGVNCAEGFDLTDSYTTMRCPLRELTPGHQYRVEVRIGPSINRLRTDTWTFSVSAPAVISSTPIPGASVPSAGPTSPISVTYDRPLDTSLSVAKLYAAPGGVRAPAPAAVAVSGAVVTVTPVSSLPDGPYNLVLVAVDADEPSSAGRSTLAFAVGPAIAFPAAPEHRPRSLHTTPLHQYLTVAAGSAMGLVVYDPADPSVRRVREVSTAPCGTGLSCGDALLPTDGLSGNLSWYAYSGTGGAVMTSPDRPITLSSGLPPSAPSSLGASAPQSPADPPWVHITGTLAPNVIGVTVLVRDTQTRNLPIYCNCAVQAGVLDAFLPVAHAPDGHLAATVTAWDASGRSSVGEVSFTKESVDLAPQSASRLPVISGQGAPAVIFNEPIRDDATAVLTDAAGHVVPGTVHRFGVRVQFYPAQALTEQTYQLAVTAAARTCTTPGFDACESWSGVVAQPVDTTAPSAASGVVVTPRAVPTGVHSVVVSGTVTPGDGVEVGVGSTTASTEPTGEGGHFSIPVNLLGQARAPLPVHVTVRDPRGLTTTRAAGQVDNRHTSVVSSLAASPTVIPYGTTTNVTGRLLRGGGTTGLGGRRVGLYLLRDNGTSMWLTRTTTSSDGAFRFTPVLTTSARLKVVFFGDGAHRLVSARTTRVAVGAPSAPVDHPGSLSAGRAAAASPQRRVLIDQLSSSGDIDVFAFGVARGGVHRIVLGRLPVPAVLELFHRDGRLISTSNRNGREFEELIRHLPAGTYLVRVRSASGAASSTAYHLSFTPLAAGPALLSSSVRKGSGPTDFLVLTDVLNTSSSSLSGMLAVTCTSTAGRVTDRSQTGFFTLHARHRHAAYNAVFCPRGSSPRISMGHWNPTTLSPLPWVSVSIGAAVPHSDGRYYPFTVRNREPRRTPTLRIQLVEYSTEGRVSGVAEISVDPLAAGASRRERGADLRFDSPPNYARYYWVVS
jgi:hypothetical protein